MGTGYSVQQIPDQTGKVVIITGANSGIGKVCSLELARKGAHVIMACRSRERTEPVVQEIITQTGNSKVEFMELNLGSLRSVVNFTNAFRAKNLPLHVLLNNAGIMATPFQLTSEGIESQFGTNHLGHFLLTVRLLDIIEASAPARIINLSSIAHTVAPKEGVNFEAITNEATYDPWTAYGQSKLCNILFTKHLQRKLGDKLVFVHAVHPGWVQTELVRGLKERNNCAAMDKMTDLAQSIFAKSPQEGALTSLYVAVAPEIQEKRLRGLYYVPTAKVAEPSALANEVKLQERLWEFSHNLVKEKLGDNAFDLTFSC